MSKKIGCPVGKKLNPKTGRCISKWERTGNNWSYEKGKYDFVIEHPKGQDYILNIFKAKIKDPDKAYVDSIELPTLISAMDEAEGWKQMRKYVLLDISHGTSYIGDFNSMIEAEKWARTHSKSASPFIFNYVVVKPVRKFRLSQGRIIGCGRGEIYDSKTGRCKRRSR